ncbi:MAG: CotS family spore coat protein [Clostridia bacterium]|nr:CotS family spore coat protein [Clostridia bacterium]
MKDREKRKLKEILAHWELAPDKIKGVRDVYQVRTAVGIRALKQVREKEEKIRFIASALQHLANQGFTKMAGLVVTRDGLPYLVHQGEYWVVNPWIDGYEPKYVRGEEMARAASTLAAFHKAAEGYRPGDGITPKNKLGRWIKKLESKAADLNHYRRMVDGKAELSPFDREFLAKAEWLCQKTRESIEALKKSAYTRLCNQYNQRKGYPLCHGDTAARNFVLNGEGDVYLIDFDSLAVDLRVIDLWRLLRRTLRKAKWDAALALQILDSYNSIYPLSNDEYKVLFALLLFPEKPWRVAKEYYEKEGTKNGWDARGLTEDLKFYLGQQADYENFLGHFAGYFRGVIN